MTLSKAPPTSEKEDPDDSAGEAGPNKTFDSQEKSRSRTEFSQKDNEQDFRGGRETHQKDATEKCDDIGVVNAESTRFMFETCIDRTICFEDGEVVVSTDTAYQEVLSEIYSVPMNPLTYC